MKLRTNRERRKRKLKKAMATVEDKKKQIHTTYKQNPCSSTIIAMVKAKTSHFTITNASSRKKIKKVVCFPRVLWTGKGTYIRSQHNRLGTDRHLGMSR